MQRSKNVLVLAFVTEIRILLFRSNFLRLHSFSERYVDDNVELMLCWLAHTLRHYLNRTYFSKVPLRICRNLN